MPNLELQRVNDFIKLMLKVTVRISSTDDNRCLIGRASGFLYHPPLANALLLITAGHKLPITDSFIDVKSSDTSNVKILQLNAGTFNIFYNNNEDYAYSKHVGQIRLVKGDCGVDVYVGDFGIKPMIVIQCNFF